MDGDATIGREGCFERREPDRDEELDASLCSANVDEEGCNVEPSNGAGGSDMVGYQVGRQSFSDGKDSGILVT